VQCRRRPYSGYCLAVLLREVVQRLAVTRQVRVGLV